MNIVVFYKAYKKYGGQERFIYNFTHYLAKKGHHVTVYAYKIGDLPANDNITIKKVFNPFPFRWMKVLYFAFFSYFKARKMKNSCIIGFGKTFYQDIYRSGGGVHLFYFKRAILKYPTRAGRILYILRKVASPSHWVNAFIEYLTFNSKRLKLVIAPSEFVKKQIVGIFGYKEDKIVIIRNGVDLNRFSPPKNRGEYKQLFGVENLPVFCFVSTNHRLKGLYYLLFALNLLKNNGYKFKLLVAGSGSDIYFKKLSKKLGVWDMIIWIGKTGNVEHVYKASDVLVYPTLFDVSSNVVLEAMACGVIPISSIYNGTSELINDGENGFLLNDPTDPLQIAEKMKLTIEMDLSRLSKNALDTIKKFPSHTLFSTIEDMIEPYRKQK